MGWKRRKGIRPQERLAEKDLSRRVEATVAGGVLTSRLSGGGVAHHRRIS